MDRARRPARSRHRDRGARFLERRASPSGLRRRDPSQSRLVWRIIAARPVRERPHKPAYSTIRGECTGIRTMRQQKHGKPSVSGEALWRFSLAFFPPPPGARTPIALQDPPRRDVHPLLFGVLRGFARRRPPPKPPLRVGEGA